jgi:hypothetical protein
LTTENSNFSSYDDFLFLLDEAISSFKKAAEEDLSRYKDRRKAVFLKQLVLLDKSLELVRLDARDLFYDE